MVVVLVSGQADRHTHRRHWGTLCRRSIRVIRGQPQGRSEQSVVGGVVCLWPGECSIPSRATTTSVASTQLAGTDDSADVFIASVSVDDGVGTAGRSVQQALSWAKHHPLIDNNNSIDGVWWLSKNQTRKKYTNKIGGYEKKTGLRKTKLKGQTTS